MHVDERVLAPVRSRFGEPRLLELDVEVGREELERVVSSGRHGRRHDVTLFIFNGDRLALIRKAHFLPGVWRPPSGGVQPGEDLVVGARREALEETGLDVALERYLVRADAVFRCGDDSIDWHTHVFSATTGDEEPEARDTVEIAAARWGTLGELNGPIRERLLATGRGLWRYRVALHDAAAGKISAASSV